MNPVSEITASIGMILGLLIIGFGGTYWYLKDKILISSGPSALFDFVVWKCFGTFAVTGAIVGYIVGGLFGSFIILMLGYWYIITFVAGCIAYILTEKNMSKTLVVGGVVAIIGLGANSYIQSNVQTKSLQSGYTDNMQNSSSKDAKESSNTKSNSQSKKKLFDGEPYGLYDLTPAEQSRADFIMRRNKGDADEAYNYIIMVRQMNGGKPYNPKQ